MSISFPTNPKLGEKWTDRESGATFSHDGEKWKIDRLGSPWKITQDLLPFFLSLDGSFIPGSPHPPVEVEDSTLAIDGQKLRVQVDQESETNILKINEDGLYVPNFVCTNLSIVEITSTYITIGSSTGNNTVIPIATISLAGLMSAIDKGKLDTVAYNANNYSHPNHSGDVVSNGDGETVIQNFKVTPKKLAKVPQNTIRGRISTDEGIVENLTAEQVRTLLQIEEIREAAQILLNPNGNLRSTDVQSALVELQEKIDQLPAIISHKPVTLADSSLQLDEQTISVKLDSVSGGGNNAIKLNPRAGLYVEPESIATEEKDGLMSAEDKRRLNWLYDNFSS